MKRIVYLLGCLFVLIALVSCVSGKPTIQDEKITKITETVHDTIFKIEKDSSALAALLECQNGKVVVKNIIESSSGRILKSPKIKLSNNILQVDCEARAQEVLAHYKDTHEQLYSYKIQTLTKEVEKQLSWWQILEIWCGRLFLLILIGYTIKFLIKIYKPI